MSNAYQRYRLSPSQLPFLAFLVFRKRHMFLLFANSVIERTSLRKHPSALPPSDPQSEKNEATL